jgi:hypothetical protein
MIFTYYSGADLLAKVIKNKTGKEFYEILRPVFDKIGVSKNIKCVEDLENHAWGGSGLLCTLPDFAKIALLILNHGKHNGEQLIDLDFMTKMCSKQISNQLDNSYFNLYNGGYGYLTWITPNATALRGMGCQQAFCFHDKNILFVCHGDTQSTTDKADGILYELFKNLIYDKATTSLPESPTLQLLKQRLDNLELPRFCNQESDIQNKINGKTYLLSPNPLGWEWLRWDFNGNDATLAYKNARGEKTLRVGVNHYVKTTFPETHYYGMKRGTPSLKNHDCLTIAEWIEPSKILLRCYAIDTSLGNFVMNLSFDEDKVSILSHKRAEFFFEDYEGFAKGVELKS